jgi:hypothetical protein
VWGGVGVFSTKKFFPPNFCFVFWKREFWREKITLQKSEFHFAKKVFPKKILHDFNKQLKLIRQVANKNPPKSKNVLEKLHHNQHSNL